MAPILVLWPGICAPITIRLDPSALSVQISDISHICYLDVDCSFSGLVAYIEVLPHHRLVFQPTMSG